MKIKFAKKKDIIIIGIILAAALVFWMLYSNLNQGAEAVVSIGYGDDIQTQHISLAKNKTYHIDARLPVTLVVEDGSIRFVNSQCPDHKCEAFGRLRGEGEYAACLPSEVVVRVEE